MNVITISQLSRETEEGQSRSENEESINSTAMSGNKGKAPMIETQNPSLADGSTLLNAPCTTGQSPSIRSGKSDASDEEQREPIQKEPPAVEDIKHRLIDMVTIILRVLPPQARDRRTKWIWFEDSIVVEHDEARQRNLLADDGQPEENGPAKVSEIRILEDHSDLKGLVGKMKPIAEELVSFDIQAISRIQVEVGGWLYQWVTVVVDSEGGKLRSLVIKL